MRPPRSRADQSSHWDLARIGDAGERRAATTRPTWASSNGARRGDVSDAEVDYLDYLSNLDGRETILPSHPLER